METRVLLSVMHFYISLVSVFLLLIKSLVKKSQTFTHVYLLWFAFTFAFVLFLVIRTDGPDVDNYRMIFEDPNNARWDFGYVLINNIANNYIEFEIFLFLLFVFQIAIYLKICKAFNVDFLSFALIYFLHLVIVRDLSQLRVGFAISVLILAFNSRTGLSVILTLIAGSIQLTSLYLLPLLFFYKFLDGQKNWSTMLILSLPLVLSNSLPIIANFEPRVNIYLNWIEPGYGAPVRGYSVYLFIGLLFLSFVICRRLRLIPNNRTQRLFILSFTYAAITFFAFRNIEIFASRLTNAALSFYPLYLATLVYSVRNSRFIANKLFLVLICILIYLLLLLRPGNEYVINSIEPALL